MDGLLGRKEQEDQYIRALLLVDGITCVAPRFWRGGAAAPPCVPPSARAPRAPPRSLRRAGP